MRAIDKIAERDLDWIKMAMSFGLDEDGAREIVQEMYIRIHKYVEDLDKIMYSKDDVNTFYIYVTLRNIHLSNISRRKYVYFSDYDLKNKLSLSAEDANIAKEEAYDRIISRIDKEVDKWYWYDKKLWQIHFYKERSMRSISNDTRISLSSIFNTLKRCKNDIRNIFREDIEDFNNEDYDRI